MASDSEHQTGQGRLSMMKGCLLIIVGGIVLVVLIGILAAILGGESGSKESAGPPPSPPKLSAQQLLAEREANATRFDATRKGKWITVSGQIENIDGGNVYLRGDGFLSNVALKDIPKEEQVPLNVGQEYSAACKVGNYILGTIFMNSCQ